MPRRDRGERDDARSGGNYRVELSDRFWPIAAIHPRELSIQSSCLPAGIKPLTEPRLEFVLSEISRLHKKVTDSLSVDLFQPIFNETYTDTLYTYNLFPRH